ncbi:HsdM family class I SAM-dependent methyltransferase [Lignipirellula cremea]|uniref:Type IIS restriction enzyme Eco57I n=1 Tax=Lignipirellula cremea TaxID=2528010 RepID=A0A518DU29_9BACT|nr:N-6 DNA methylase [Lignipirellula cremea]QDU95341.1 Type IIS restriction enzyme Eco57I [Lignipirellula cremea]
MPNSAPSRSRRDPTPGSLLTALRGDASLPSLQAALIQAKLSPPGQPPTQLIADSWLAQAIKQADRQETERAAGELAQLGPLTLKQVEGGFESLLANDAKKKRGAVYTPDYIIDALLQGASEHCQATTAPVICDPACGSGGFLLRAARLLATRHNLSPRQVLEQLIVGFDKDPQAATQARCLLELYLHEQADIGRAPDCVFERDTLLTPPDKLWQAAGKASGFDIVATNPPYIKLQNLPPEERQALEQSYGQFLRGSYSTGMLFILAATRLLAPGGAAALIVQNNLFTSLAGEPLRRELLRDHSVRRIVDFGDARIFPEASAYTCLLFLGGEKQPSLEYVRIEQPTAKAIQDAPLSLIPTDQLRARKWRLAPAPHFENLQRLESAGPPLGTVARIQVGFATLKDAVFLARDSGDSCESLDGAPIEREATRPAIKVADLTSDDDLAANTLRVIFPYELREGRHQLLAENQMQRRFPAALAHLARHRPELEQRDHGRSKAEAWYAWGRTQGRIATGPKLLTKTFDSRPRFLLDRSDALFCNGYSVTPRPDSPWSIEALSRLLNTRLLAYYLKLTSFQIRGGFLCFQKNFLEGFAAPPLSAAQLQSFPTLSNAAAERLLCRAYGVNRADLDEVWPAGKQAFS